jgi:hypothetical protein
MHLLAGCYHIAYLHLKLVVGRGTPSRFSAHQMSLCALEQLVPPPGVVISPSDGSRPLISILNLTA